MSEAITFEVEKREGLGKGANRKLRLEGKVPGIFYSVGGENIPVKMPHNAVVKLWEKAGKTNIITLKIDGEEKQCLIWNVERHPFKNLVQHVDFYGVDLDKPLRVKVPVKMVGTPPAVKLGGRLEQYREMITIEAKPADLPNFITVDVSGLDFQQSIKSDELEMPEGVSVYTTQHFKIVNVSLPRGGKAATEDEG